MKRVLFPLLAALLVSTTTAKADKPFTTFRSSDVLTHRLNYTGSELTIKWEGISDPMTFVGVNAYGNASSCSNEDLYAQVKRAMRIRNKSINLRKVESPQQITGLGDIRNLISREQSGMMFIALVNCRPDAGDDFGIYALVVDLEGSEEANTDGSYEFVPEAILKVAIKWDDPEELQSKAGDDPAARYNSDGTLKATTKDTRDMSEDELDEYLKAN